MLSVVSYWRPRGAREDSEKIRGIGSTWMSQEASKMLSKSM